MKDYPKALSHDAITEVFPDIYFVTGAMETVLHDMDWQFSRNMTVVKEDDRLIILNSVRLDEATLEELDKLGQVTDVIRLGCLHGRDDAFFVDRYQANYWTLSTMPSPEPAIQATHFLDKEKQLPMADASLFSFQATQIPEAILHIEKHGGILIACDALQNWLAPDKHFSESSKNMMTEMGFFTPANVGPVWQQVAAPKGSDFEALMTTFSFEHALCGHGEPLLNQAKQQFQSTFDRLFKTAT